MQSRLLSEEMRGARTLAEDEAYSCSCYGCLRMLPNSSTIAVISLMLKLLFF